ncbi:MAG: hypothetical protein PHI31_05680 [Desulfuromonadaceae bacterium]|nr:hypothetical protein [Desulfuromonadaceae bacterium]
MKHAFRIFLFLFFFVVIYVFTLMFFSKFQINDKSLLQSISNYNVRAGVGGQTLRRFREINEVNNVDILFIGSSHTYRGFDPRIFASYGYTSYNMGSSAQTPLNTYFLLKRYLKQINPKLVVFEIYPLLLSKDGLESYFDLVTNIPISYNILEMAFAVKNPHALHILVKNQLDQLKAPLSSINQNEVENEIYISGGYCETKFTQNRGLTNILTKGKGSVKPSEKQIEYVRKIIKFVKEKCGSNIIIVTQPLPHEYVEATNNYFEITEKIAEIANEREVKYIDYNKIVKFNSMTDFFDNDHLTSSGVKKFNMLLLHDLK